MEPQSHEELVTMTGKPIERELVNKYTGEVYPVLVTSFGEEEVTFSIGPDDIVFKNPNKSGDLYNEEWEVREIA